MIIHLAIRYFITKQGTGVLLNSRLYNLLSDYDIFQFEVNGLKPTVKSILETYGARIHNAIINKLPVEVSIADFKKHCLENYGFKEDYVVYIFDSLSFGLNIIQKVDNIIQPQYSQKYCLANAFDYNPIGGLSSRCKFMAYYYHFLGINITYLNKDVRNNNPDFNSFKDPIDSNWQYYQDRIQTIEYIKSQDWDSATGIGAVLGFNDLRALDIDGLFAFNVVNGVFCHHNEDAESFIKKCLELLCLPLDYEWVTRSGSGSGIHIIFRAKDIDGFVSDVYAFDCSRFRKSRQEGCHRVELCWNKHLVLPPSASKNCYWDDYVIGRVSGYFQYRFNNHNYPQNPPKYVSIDALNNFLNYFCASIGVRSGYIPSGYEALVGNTKLVLKYGSWGVTETPFKDSIEWLSMCTSPDAMNSLGVLYAIEGNYNKAKEYFILSNTPHSNYNLSLLVAKKCISGTKANAINYYEKASEGEYADSYRLLHLKLLIEQMDSLK